MAMTRCVVVQNDAVGHSNAVVIETKAREHLHSPTEASLYVYQRLMQNNGKNS